MSSSRTPAAARRRPAGPGPQRGCQLDEELLGWLEKKRINIPAGMACGSLSAATRESAVDLANVLAALPGLRERERRALSRFLEQRERRRREVTLPTQPALSSDDEDMSAQEGPPTILGGAWPASVKYTNNYEWGSDVPEAERAANQPTSARMRSKRPCKRVKAALINDTNHPAFGQFGLFAARQLPYGKR